MANRQKAKGDRAELEVQGILRDLLGVPARRALGAGRKDDMGDVTGVPQTVIQVASWADALRAIREKPVECEQQRLRAWRAQPNPSTQFYAATFVRLRGGLWRVVLTPEQWAEYARETIDWADVEADRRFVFDARVVYDVKPKHDGEVEA